MNLAPGLFFYTAQVFSVFHKLCLGQFVLHAVDFGGKAPIKKDSLVLVPPTKASFHWPTDHGKSMSFLTFEACRASFFSFYDFGG